jgi:hypothetical protein
MFHPEANPRSMREDLVFVAAHAGHPLSFCRTEIYTGTPLEQRMRSAGRAVDALGADFAAFELEANRDTLAAIEAVFALYEAYPDP